MHGAIRSNQSAGKLTPRGMYGNRKRQLKRMAKYIALLVAIAVVSFPTYIVALAALRPGSDVLITSLGDLLPVNISLENFRSVIGEGTLLRFVANSLIVALSTTSIAIVVSALGGYALVRLPFPGSRFIARSVLFTYVVPSVLLVIPIFSIINGLGLYNSLPGVVLAHTTFALPFCLWLLRAYFSTLPSDVEEAALVDGCSRLGALRKVILPLAAPGIAAAAMFVFILSWNEYLYALVLLRGPEVQTLPIGIVTNFFNLSMTGDDWARLMAASVLASLPVIVGFIFLQRWFVTGLAAGSVKG